MKDFANLGKFQDPRVTATGEKRATVSLTHPETLWFNTGTLCNITCNNCYIESSPTNDALVYISVSEVVSFLEQLEDRRWGVREIAFTGGEPFMNPEIIDMMQAGLSRGYDLLVLTNAMSPMMRPKMKSGIATLVAQYGDKLTFRISIDHYTAATHDAERGNGSFEKTLRGTEWLSSIGARMAVAGRIEMAESEVEARQGYAGLFAAHGWDIEAFDPAATVLFPEMDGSVDVPEITTSCWSILNKNPNDVMCASSRMVIKRKGATVPAIVSCTLLPYDPQFELGHTLADAERDVSLSHPHCAKFCVLGGASCSG